MLQKRRNFPEAIKENGVEEGEDMIFISKENKKNVLMRAKHDSIETIDEEDIKLLLTGNLFPVYVKLIKTYIYTGVSDRIA